MGIEKVLTVGSVIRGLCVCVGVCVSRRDRKSIDTLMRRSLWREEVRKQECGV